MEETLSLIYHGCKLARNLEQNLPKLSNQSNTLSNYCDEIAKVFKIATDRLNNNPTFSSKPTVEAGQPLTQASNEVDNIAVQEWLRSSYAQVIEHAHANAQAQSSNDSMVASSGFKTYEFGGMVRAHIKELLHMGEGSSGSVTQRSRKRKDGQEQRTVRVGTPRMGNPEIPPDDGFTWRKYGQKEILGSTYPRGYYRCTHKTFYGCDAKKQVQRLDDDPTMFEVTYYGNHTCHMSQTAPAPTPSAAPPTVSTIVHQEHHPDAPSHPTSLPLYRWLSMDMGGGGVSGQEDTMPLTDLQLQMYTDFSQLGGSGVLTSTVGAGPSNSRDADFPVLDLADVMFNSGGSSNSNSMDSIFPFSMHDNS